MANDAITLSSYSELNFDTVMRLYLYGAMETPDYYVDRVRPYSERGVAVEMPAFDYMASGPGRYARASEAGHKPSCLRLQGLPESFHCRA